MSENIKIKMCNLYTSHEQQKKKYWIAVIELSKNDNTKTSQI